MGADIGQRMCALTSGSVRILAGATASDIPAASGRQSRTWILAFGKPILSCGDIAEDSGVRVCTLSLANNESSDCQMGNVVDITLAMRFLTQWLVLGWREEIWMMS